MPREETLKNVPTNEVGVVVQGFVDDGASQIRAEKNISGNWDITAYFV